MRCVFEPMPIIDGNAADTKIGKKNPLDFVQRKTFMDALGTASALVQLPSSFPNTELIVLTGQCDPRTLTGNYTQIDQCETSGPINAISCIGTKSMAFSPYSNSMFLTTYSIIGPIRPYIAIDSIEQQFGNVSPRIQSYLDISGSIIKLFVSCVTANASQISTNLLSCVMPLIVYH